MELPEVMEAGAEGGATGRENVRPEEVKQMKSDRVKLYCIASSS